MKRIVLLIDSLKIGGKERVMSELATYFSSRKGMEIHLILFGSRPRLEFPLPEGVRIYQPDFEYQTNSRIWYAMRTLFFIRRKVRSIRPDSVLSFGEIWNAFVLLALYGLNYPVFISDRCQPDKKFSTFQEFLRRWLYPRASGMIAQSRKAGEIYQSAFKSLNIKVIGNPIQAVQGSYSDTGRENIILSVGRMIPTKHHRELIELFLEMDRHDWKLVIVGGDAGRNRILMDLQALVSRQNAEERVQLLGERDDVERFYERSRIFAFTSSSEGFPNVIGEALAYGLPPVSFDCVAGPSELIQNGENGYLIPLFDYQSFGDHLARLMDDAALRKNMGAKARDSVRSKGIDNIGESYLQFILHEDHTD